MHGEWQGKPAESCPGGFEKDPDPDGNMVESAKLRRKRVPFEQLVETVRTIMCPRVSFFSRAANIMMAGPDNCPVPLATQPAE